VFWCTEDPHNEQIDAGCEGTMSHSGRDSPSSLGMRPAFTIVELLVAIVVFTIGVVALAATSGLVAAGVGDGGRLTAAAHAARTVLDSLGATSCGRVVSGSAAREGLTIQWSATRDSTAAHVELSVGTALRRGSARDAYRLVVPCVRE
jgi:prepilin-type N-terminal cleavage/methylation domain-containing protein